MINNLKLVSDLFITLGRTVIEENQLDFVRVIPLVIARLERGEQSIVACRKDRVIEAYEVACESGSLADNFAKWDFLLCIRPNGILKFKYNPEGHISSKEYTDLKVELLHTIPKCTYMPFISLEFN